MIELPGATGPAAGVLVRVIDRFGFVLIVSDDALLERVPDVAASATVAVFEIDVVPEGAPAAATVMLNDTVADDPAGRLPMFFDSTLPDTGSGVMVTPFSFALLGT